VFNLPVPPDRQSTEYIRSYRGWVYSSVTLIAQSVASIELELFKRKVLRTGVETDQVFEHPILSLLSHVNDFTTFYQLIEITQTYLELVGEAYWLVLRQGGKPIELWALRPDWITVHPSPTEFVSHYTYRPFGSGEEVRLDKEDVVPFKNVNPENPYRGFSTVRGMAMSIDINDFSDQWQRAFFYNSAMPSIIFTTDQKLGKESIDRFMKSWEAKFQGPKKAHQIAFLGGGMKPDFVPNGLNDMDFVNLQKWVRDEILAGFRVSKANLGITEDVNRATQEATDIRFTKSTIRPKIISLTTQLNEFLLPMFEDDSLFFDFVDPVPRETEKDLAIYENALKFGWMTINEVREREKLDSAEGGDVIYLPFNLQPLGAIGEAIGEKIKGFFGKKSDEQKGLLTLEVKKKKKKRKHNIPIPPKRLKQLNKELRLKEIKDGIKPDIVKLIGNIMSQKDSPRAMKESIWKETVAQTEVWELRVEGVVKQLFRDQMNEVLDKITGKKDLKPIEEILFVLAVANEKWRKALIPILSTVIIDRSLKVFQNLGVDGSLNIQSNVVQSFLKDQSGEMIKQINEFTLDKLRNELSAGVASGEGNKLCDTGNI
jgi:HK97 family phage portal protein